AERASISRTLQHYIDDSRGFTEHCGRASVGWKSAESSNFEDLSLRSANHHPGRTDPRRRYRRQVRDLPNHRWISEGRKSRLVNLIGDERTSRHGRSSARNARRQVEWRISARRFFS